MGRLGKPLFTESRERNLFKVIFVNIGLEMLTTEKEMKKDTGMMLEKQDKTIGAIREVSEKIDRGKEDVVTEIRSLRESFL